MKGFAKERNDETVGKLSFDEYHCHHYGMCSTQILVNPKVLDSNSKELKYCVSQQVPDSDEAKYEKIVLRGGKAMQISLQFDEF